MTRRRRGRISTAVGSLSLALGCASVFGLDEYRDAVTELCGLLERCYAAFPACEEHVGSGLRDAAPDERRSWLTAFADRACLENCTSARGCLDLSPVCNGVGESCDVSEHCCGFSKGLASCDAARGACCVARGVRCSSNDECCEDAGRCQALATDETVKTCGGVLCKLGGEACASAGDCCSSVCEGGVCLETACLPDGSLCAVDTDCCTSPCVGGLCGGVECGGEGYPCVVPEECCDGLVCFMALADAQGFCSSPSCLPDLKKCFDGAECCSGYCNPYSFVCDVPTCAPVGGSCNVAAECCSLDCQSGTCVCVPDGGVCITSDGCCSGICSESVCVGMGCTPPPECSHDVCTMGPPLSSECACECEPCVDTGCVKAVCDKDPYCCTTGWDQLCVQEVGDSCGVECAPPPMPPPN